LHNEDTRLTEPTLYVVATPIGNLRDITLRAIEVLRSVESVAAEDTRVTQKLLSQHGIHAKLFALHGHNEQVAATRLIAVLAEGKSVAIVSDAGTPGISDPGTLAVAQVREAGFRVVPIPGANAAIAAIAAAGMPAATFYFHGFLPARKGDRESALTQLVRQAGLLVFYEAPHRILGSVESMAAVFGGDRRIGIARELTKVFEQVHVCRLAEAGAWLQADDDHRRGEFVLLVEGCAEGDVQSEDDSLRVLELLLDELPLKQAVKLAAEITGTRKNALYQRALELKKDKKAPASTASR
jgi:16S rRNA (cytidine1402-2'-O)-methyltransferase